MFHLFSIVSSQLYRSSSFNSSGCGSTGDPGEDMYSDVSLEEDVQGLNYKVSFCLYNHYSQIYHEFRTNYDNNIITRK